MTRLTLLEVLSNIHTVSLSSEAKNSLKQSTLGIRMKRIFILIVWEALNISAFFDDIIFY